MSLADKHLHLCSCNGTMPLDAAALAPRSSSGTRGADDAVPEGAGRLRGRAAGDVVVACTQEARLFGESRRRAARRRRSGSSTSARPAAGRPRRSRDAQDRRAARRSPDCPSPRRCRASPIAPKAALLIVGPAEAALQWAKPLSRPARRHGARHRPRERRRASGGTRFSRLLRHASRTISGWLGAFDVVVDAGKSDRPRSVHALQCVRAMRVPRTRSISRTRSTSIAARPTASASPPAARRPRSTSRGANVARSERFDLVLDLQRTPPFADAPAAAGLFRARRRRRWRKPLAVAEIATLTGEFEKPKYFAYKASICAHSRSRQPGCNQCIDVCSTRAIVPDGDHVKVEPQLCMGCGACATVCPSGAMSYAYPARARSRRSGCARCSRPTRRPAAAMRASCSTPRTDARAIADLARRGRGLPARVIPFEVHHVASVGLDVWLAALAHGASQVAVLATGAEAPQYREALEAQMRHRRHDRAGAGLPGRAFPVVDGGDPKRAGGGALVVAAGADGRACRRPSRSPPTSARRAALAIDHLAQHAPVPQREIALPAGAPFGAIAVDRDTCTMCLACVGACPEGAILDKREAPQLSFIEAKCVQCGLCAGDVPRGRDHAGPAAVPRAGGAATARDQRSRRRRLHRLRQAARHRKDGRRACWRSSPVIRCSPRPARSTACGCAPTAAWSIS